MLEAVSAGVPIAQACLHAGISESAHFRAIEAGELAQAQADAGNTLTAREDAYREYRESILRARAAVAVVHVALVGKAARGGQVWKETTRREPDGSVTTEREFTRPEWKASQFLLATSFRDEFGPPTRRQVEHSGPDGGPIEHAGPGETAVSALAERLAAVAEQQRQQLPGGWDPGTGEGQPAESHRAIAAGPAVRVDLDDVADAELVDEERRP